jgi:hypothetical protein
VSGQREVKIVFNEKKRVLFVDYVKREKFGRYHAAQFDTKYSNREEVEAWIATQPNLKLVP